MLANINRYIKNTATDDADQFPLSLLNLVMQAAQHMLARAGVVILNKLHRLLQLVGKNFLIEALKEKPPIVHKHARLNQ